MILDFPQPGGTVQSYLVVFWILATIFYDFLQALNMWTADKATANCLEFGRESMSVKQGLRVLYQESILSTSYLVALGHIS